MRVNDRTLGMDRKITRRDFLNGVTIGIGSITSGMLSGSVSEVLAGERTHARRDYYRQV